MYCTIEINTLIFLNTWIRINCIVADFGLSVVCTSPLCLALETALCVLKDDNNWIQCLLGSVNNLIGRKHKAVAPCVPEFPNVRIRGVESTSNPVDASSAGRVYRNKKRVGGLEMNISLNKIHILILLYVHAILKGSELFCWFAQHLFLRY